MSDAEYCPCGGPPCQTPAGHGCGLQRHTQAKLERGAEKRADWGEDEPVFTGDWVECWKCAGEGGWEDDDPFWPIDWVRCDICEGKGGWEYQPNEEPAR